MLTDESEKIHGDKLETHKDRQNDTRSAAPQDALVIPDAQEHPTEASLKIHGDKLEPESE
jgi:hypothetical protein